MQPRQSSILRRLSVASVSLATALANATGPAAAASTHSFDGSCASVYVTRFSAPPTLIPALIGYNSVLRGTCFGTLDGRALSPDGVPVTAKFGGTALISCEATSDDNPEIRLVFHLPHRHRATLGTHMTDHWLLVGSAFTGDGNQSGELFGTSQAEGSSDGLTKCANGSLTQAAVSMDFLTITTLIG
jgi:hypothetical protein